MASSLFDDEDFAPAVQAETEPQSDWQEVPQARFLSWTPAMQLAYCAARDEDAAEFSETLAEAEWYIARAASYRELSQCTPTT